MERKINYQKNLDKTLIGLKNEKKTLKLLLHSCCAPCSSYVLEYLSEIFNITIFFYNPNIYPEKEYKDRIEEQKRLVQEIDFKNRVNFLESKYNISEFLKISEGLESCLEGGVRCLKCYEIRLRETAKKAKEKGYDYFTTTLTVSPYKNSEVINKIGEKISQEIKMKYLSADFKKRDGYKRSISLSKKYNLYRQNYCGCIYSKN